MLWDDDSWKDGYDAWKLASPYDEYDEPCDHEDREIDTIEGRARCHRCGESWYASEEEILIAIDSEAAYARYEERETRRQRWFNLWEKIRTIIPCRKRALVNDDDIPF